MRPYGATPEGNAGAALGALEDPILRRFLPRGLPGCGVDRLALVSALCVRRSGPVERFAGCFMLRPGDSTLQRFSVATWLGSASLWRAPKEAARGVVCVDEALGRAREWSLSLKGNGLGALVSFFCELPFEFRHAMIQPADELLGSHLLCGQDVEPGLEAQKSPRRTGCGFWGLTLCRRVGRIRHERCVLARPSRRHLTPGGVRMSRAASGLEYTLSCAAVNASDRVQAT